MVKPKYKKVVSGAVAAVLPAGYEPPGSITFTSDDTEVQFEAVSLRSTHRKYDLYIYRYTKASPTSGKLQSTIPFSKQDLELLETKDYALFGRNSEGKHIKILAATDP